MTSLFTAICRKYVGAICFLIAGIILIAGLWPRDFSTRNEVAFLPDGKGIHFSRRGIIYSKDQLVNQYAQSEPGALSFELALQSDMVGSNTIPVILSIDDGQSCERFVICQWKSNLIIRSMQTASCRYERSREIGVQYALLKGSLRFIGITSSARGTAVYVDGKLQELRKGLSLLNPDEMLAGQLVLGNSAAGKDPWTGTIYTLAIYDHVLSSEEVLQHYYAWHEYGSLPTKVVPLPIAFYHFNELTGPIVRDHSGMGNDLVIPEHFTPLRRRMLVMPWKDFHANRSYATDVLINIIGFIPFGFFISWYLSEKNIAHYGVVIIAMALGICTSLFIEIIQAYLPARSSEIMDVLSNSGGTALGIYLWRRYISPLLPVTINRCRTNQ